MTPLIEKYPEDWTGTLVSNHILGEEHTVPRVKNKCFALDVGPFYTTSLVIRVKTTGKELVRNKDYRPIFLYQHASLYAGKEVCAAIAIINPDISGVLTVDYRVIGGTYVTLVDALYQAIEQLQLDDSSINWDDIKNKPELYPPEPHVHHVSAIYGTEHICQAIYGLKEAMIIGDGQSLDLIWNDLDQLRKEILAGDKTNSDALSVHEQRKDNPHQVTKTHIGLNLVMNYGIANQAESEAGVATDKYMTPQAVAWAIAKQSGAMVNAHITDYNNPHRVTKAQVNLGNVLNYGMATQAEAEEGVSETKYMNPFRTAQAIAKLVTPILNTHINNKNNPHEVTATQVGLGNVLNYGMATQAEAENGATNAKYMSPQMTAFAITKQAIAPLNVHIANKSNPHEVTKTQVGLSNVQNYGMATQAEAEAGTVDNKYMSPVLVSQAISKLVIPILNIHVQDKNNPHQVTKTQIGLGSVQNYGVATDADALAATSRILYMTPYGVGISANKISVALVDAHAANKSNPHEVTKTQVGLGNVQNFDIATAAQALNDVNNVYITPSTGRVVANTVLNSRRFTGAVPTNDLFVYTGTDQVTRVGQTLAFYQGGVQRTKLSWVTSTTGGKGAGLDLNGNIDVANIYVRSDARTKNNIRYFKDNPESILDKLLLMSETSLARYQYKHDNGLDKIGVIAQDVQQIFPELVTEGYNGILSLDIPGYLAVLLAGITEQQKILETLQAKII